MTRFQIIGIFDDEILTAGEFNGDGYFQNGFGQEICRLFAQIKNKNQYKSLVEYINDSFHYETDNLINQVNIPYALDFKQIEEKKEYYDIWFSDYLYIINLSTEDQKIIDENGVEITLRPSGWVTIYFGELCDVAVEIKSINNAIIKEN